ncbi:MAG TPA: polysaccharide deacetylase family protein [Actinomycetota bacterium]|nr:polysaccharide deacetylase family protein [Actinomycetota bacterium]
MLALAFPLVTAERASDLTPPIDVRVRQQDQYVRPGTTFGDAVREFKLHAHTGALLDVEGQVIDANKFPGAILLNDKPAGSDVVLSDGDVIRVVSQQDQTEGTVRTVEEVPGGLPANPQFYLGTTPGEQIVVKGRVSGKIVSSKFQATGPSTTPNAVALTFDDGPSRVYTPQILAILQHFGVKATFFTIGFEIDEFPDVIREEHTAGMVIGNHTWDHPEHPPFRDLPAAKIRDEMQKTTDALNKLGVDPYLFRPPGGTYGDTELSVAQSLGMRVVLWSIDPQDWRSDIKPKEIVDNVLSHVHAGSIILMHDGGGFQDATVKALPKIIKGIRAKGLDIVPILP